MKMKWMQKIFNVKTLNSRKQIFCPECESNSFEKLNLRKILRKSIIGVDYNQHYQFYTMVATLI